MKAVGMIMVYNEADIIEQVLQYHVSQGLELVVVDNGSSDGSYEIIDRYLGQGVVDLQRIPTDYFDARLLLMRLSEMASRQQPDWAVLIGADEFLETPNASTGETLAQGLKAEAAKGYGLIQFDCFEFWPTREDDMSKRDVRRRMRHYTWTDSFHYRAYRWVPGISAAETGGHYPIVPPGITLVVSPRKFMIRHYKIRSYQHGLRKVFKERLPRFGREKEPQGWNLQYDKFLPTEQFFVGDTGKFTLYSEDGKWLKVRKFDTTFGAYNPPPDDWTPPVITKGPTVQELRADLEDKTNWAKKLDEELSQRDQTITKLQADLEDKTNWAKKLDEELSQRDQTITKLQADLEDKTNWAKKLDEELSQRDQTITKLQADLEDKTNWAKKLDEELSQRDQTITKLQADLEDKTNWAKKLDEELSQRDQTIRKLQADLEDRTTTKSRVRKRVVS